MLVTTNSEQVGPCLPVGVNQCLLVTQSSGMVVLDSQSFVENRKRVNSGLLDYLPRIYFRAGPIPYVSFLLEFVALRLATLAELVRLVVFRGAAILVAFFVRIGLVFAPPLVQHGELQTLLFVRHSKPQKLVQL